MSLPSLLRHHGRHLSHRKRTCWAARWCRSSFNQEIEKKNRTQPLSIYFWSKLHASNICFINRIECIYKRWDSEQKCCGGIKVYTPAALALTAPWGNLDRNFFLTSSPANFSLETLLRHWFFRDQRNAKNLGNQLQPQLLGWKPIDNITSYERTDAFPSVQLLLDIIFYANTLNHLFLENPFSFGKDE